MSIGTLQELVRQAAVVDQDGVVLGHVFGIEVGEYGVAIRIETENKDTTGPGPGERQIDQGEQASADTVRRLVPRPAPRMASGSARIDPLEELP